ncbi:MAG: hypothetical protein RTV72_00660 [Candidatus Thorarchaeota archaeon]
MTENRFLDKLQRMLDKKVKVYVYTLSNHQGFGYIVEIGDDFIRVRTNWKENAGDIFIPMGHIDKVTTYWKEK